MGENKVTRAWYQMRYRCNNSNAHNYAHYGGRGIKICPEWEDKEVFINDMRIPLDGYSLDRIDNDGDYNKNNCRWATWSEQTNNRRAFGRIKEQYITMIDESKPYRLRIGKVSLGNYLTLEDAVETRDAILGGYDVPMR